MRPVSLLGWMAVVAHASGPDSSYKTDVLELTSRALPDAANGYAPIEVDCPSPRPSLRSAVELSAKEQAWLKLRRKNTHQAMKDFFGHIRIGEFDSISYLEEIAGSPSNLPNIGIAVSGGGYRALMNGAGALKAFDSRTANATASGQLGGLLQSATYLAGLSGGGWLLGSLYMNNFTTVSSLQSGGLGTTWQFSNSILKGPDDGGPLLTSAIHYYTQVAEAVGAKGEAGYPTTLTDLW